VKPGSHAAGDGSFGWSAGIQVGRAVALIAVAVLLGLFLLHRSGPGGGSPALASATSTTSTTAPPSSAPPPTPTSSSVAVKSPQSVKVLVANGSGVAGLAGRLSSRLHTQGYDTVSQGTNANQAVTTSKVYYTTGFVGEAGVLAQFLKLPPSAAQPMPNPPPVSNLAAANVVVDAGPDLSTATGSTGTSGGTGGGSSTSSTSSTGSTRTTSTTRFTG
jgi:hypothetical protein